MMKECNVDKVNPALFEMINKAARISNYNANRTKKDLQNILITPILKGLKQIHVSVLFSVKKEIQCSVDFEIYYTK